MNNKEKKVKIKYRMKPDSNANLVSAILSLLSLVLFVIVFWTVFYKYFQNDDTVSTAMIIYYGILMACLLLYSLSTWIFARKSPGVAVIFGIPVALLALFEVTALRHLILFFNRSNLFGYYKLNSDYFWQMLPFIAALCVLTLFGFLFYLRICFGSTTGKFLPMLLVLLSAVGWLAYSGWRIYSIDFAQYQQGLLNQGTLIFTVMMYTAFTFFFFSQVIVVGALKKPDTSPVVPPYTSTSRGAYNSGASPTSYTAELPKSYQTNTDMSALQALSEPTPLMSPSAVYQPILADDSAAPGTGN